MQRVHVVAAIIYNQNKSKILIARRPDHLHLGGLWEFPGGKVDVGEHPEKALVRELKEELAIDVEGLSPALLIHHDYPDKNIMLDVWQVEAFSGEPKGNEGQQIEWVPLGGLGKYQFPEANRAIIDWLETL